jgi:transcriptional regulator with XRE-family HTH domain
MTSTHEATDKFSRRLDYLFKRVTHSDGREYTYDEVQRGTDKAVTAQYIWRLRTGKAKNPSYMVIVALSDFFGVEPAYFFEHEEEAKSLAEDVAYEQLVKHIRDTHVEDIAMRASQLNESGRKAILGMLDFILTTKSD